MATLERALREGLETLFPSVTVVATPGQPPSHGRYVRYNIEYEDVERDELPNAQAVTLRCVCVAFASTQFVGGQFTGAQWTRDAARECVVKLPGMLDGRKVGEDERDTLLIFSARMETGERDDGRYQTTAVFDAALD